MNLVSESKVVSNESADIARTPLDGLTLTILIK